MGWDDIILMGPKPRRDDDGGPGLAPAILAVIVAMLLLRLCS